MWSVSRESFVDLNIDVCFIQGLYLVLQILIGEGKVSIFGINLMALFISFLLCSSKPSMKFSNEFS